MYKKVSSDFYNSSREKDVVSFWQENDIFQKSIDSRSGGKEFTFYDGPPTANGKPHIGHILTRVIKDLIPRYKTMKGYHVLRKAGWDTHGLPVELEVEKMLEIDGKDQIENYGVEPFIQKCKESVWKYKNEWEEMSERVGFWADMKEPYITYDDNFIESEWWALRQIWDKDLIYKGHKIVPYCPRCGTSLSSHEVAQGYKDVKETSVFVRFKVTDEENTYFAAWTTTPWTLPSNVSLCVNEKEEYVLLSVDKDVDGTEKDTRYYMAHALASKLFGEDFTIISTMLGKDLIGKSYEPLLPYAEKFVAESGKKAFFVTADDYVTLTDGTGIVHIAPAFGEDDARVGRNNGLPFVQLVKEDGTLPESCEEFAGVFCKEADKGIMDKLFSEKKLIKRMPYEHSYPFCWRCDTPLIYYARNTWFIKMTEMRENLVRNNKTINWIPENIRDGRFGNFLENVIDWGISRERYWGTPLPIWVCSCGHMHLVGSKEELKAMSEDCPDEIELHKPYIDKVHLKCTECGGTMTRVPEVIDCWFDSGSMPFAQWHYPFENKEIFDAHYPADFISEAIDQTRGWFYTLLAISTLLFDKAPYKNVIVLGHVQDKDGQKMSKHKGNVVDPWDVLNKEGADAVRWYFYSNSAPWLPNRFSHEAISDSQRKFLGTLWNVYSFYILYAEIDKFDPTKYTLDPQHMNLLDKWIISKLNTLIQEVDKNLDNYKITESARALQAFVEDLSNWYIRRNRERYWKENMDNDKISAYMTLNHVLVTLCKLSAPFVPFTAEEIYRNIVCTVDKNAPESIHLCDFPVVDTTVINAELERNMDEVLRLIALGRACRNTANAKIRQPLSKMYVISSNDDTSLTDDFAELVLNELNIKTLINIKDANEFVSYKFKPQLKTLGRKYGKLIPSISQYLAGIDGDEAMKTLRSGDKIVFEIDGTTVELEQADLLIENAQKPGFFSESDDKFTVVLDVNLTDELIEEGIVREVISKLQNMRKDAGFEVVDHIKIGCVGSSVLIDVIKKHKEHITSQVLADEITFESTQGFTKEWNINKNDVTISVEKI